MHGLTADLFVTVDGFAAGEDVGAFFGLPGPELEAWIEEELDRPQVLLLGRVTYETLAGMRRPADDVTAPMDALPKVVFSHTLRAPLAWSNSRLATGELADEVMELKRSAEAPLRSIGSLSMVRSLLRLGLVDRLRLMTFPLLLGDAGREPVFAGAPAAGLDLVEASVLDGRLVLLEYRPAQGS